MDSEDSPGVPSMWPYFLSETGGVAQVLNGKVVSRDPLVTVEGSDWLLWGRDQILLIHWVFIRLLTAFSYDL